MPVYGQPTELNQRLSSLMSCIFCNSNDLYDGIGYSVKLPPSITPSHISSRRPLFTEAILRKASTLEETRRKPNSFDGDPTAKASTVLEVVLVADQEDGDRCNLLAKLVSRLFAMPEEHSDKLLLEVTTVRSHAIREDLAAARSSRSTGGIPRRQVFVGLGYALQGLCLYLQQKEVTRLRLLCSKDSAKLVSPSLLLFSTAAILGVVCVDPPPHLWKTCGRSILDQTSLEGIPSLFVGYTEKGEKGVVEGIPASLGKLLIDCRRYPRALALVAKDSANILGHPSISTTKDEKRILDACVWLARVITKYTESVQRIHTPPGGQPLGMRKEKEPMRSML